MHLYAYMRRLISFHRLKQIIANHCMSTWQTNLFFQGMPWASLHLLAQQWRPWGVWWGGKSTS